jgi:hypothetical protein
MGSHPPEYPHNLARIPPKLPDKITMRYDKNSRVYLAKKESPLWKQGTSNDCLLYKKFNNVFFELVPYKHKEQITKN